MKVRCVQWFGQAALEGIGCVWDTCDSALDPFGRVVILFLNGFGGARCEASSMEDYQSDLLFHVDETYHLAWWEAGAVGLRGLYERPCPCMYFGGLERGLCVVLSRG